MSKILKRGNRLFSSLGAILLSRSIKGGVAVGYHNINNFGDQLTPDILTYFGAKVFFCPRFQKADMIGVGSILHKLPSFYDGFILGSGLIDEKSANTFPNAKVLLVRGRLTRKLCSFPENLPIGDPGLIVDTVYKNYICSTKIWEIGIVPHYKDINEEKLLKIRKLAPAQIKFINVKRKPEEVIHEISKCKLIVSSSLHGLIVADSLGIPNCWVKISDSLIGGCFKFNDYYSCFGEERKPIECEKINDMNDLQNLDYVRPDQEQIELIKLSIIKSFEEFCSKLIN